MSGLVDALSVRGKILAILGAAVLAAGGCVIVGATALRTTTADVRQIQAQDVGPALEAANATTYGARYRRLAVQMILAHTPDEVSTTTSKLADLEAKQDAALAGLQRSVTTPSQKQNVAEASRAWAQTKDVFHAKIEPGARRTELTEDELWALGDVAYNEFGAAADRLADALDALQADSNGLLQDDVQDAVAVASSAQRTLYTAFLAAGILLVAFALWVARGLATRMARLRDAMVRLGRGDLTAQVVVDAGDEVGQMAAALGDAQAILRESMTTIVSSSATLAGSAEELSTVSAQVAASAEETSVQSGTAAAAAEEVSRNVQTVAAATEEMSAAIMEISQSSTEAVRVAQSAADEAQNAVGTISKLGDSSREIGDVVKVITSIAEQTNLLALNATIEAARAGEAGKGFAVVASEVKDLAQETARATEDISRRIEAIQTDSEAAVAAIARISEIIEEVNSYQSTIAAAVEEQTATTGEMSRSVQEAAAGADGIAGNIEHVATAAQSSSTGIVEAQRAAAELAQLSGDLRELVARYTV